MKLSELKKGDRAIIKEIKLEDGIKQRLLSMGLVKNEFIYICRVGFLGGSFYIKVACDSCIIVSKNEADRIEVQKVGKGYQHRWGKRDISKECMSCCQEE